MNRTRRCTFVNWVLEFLLTNTDEGVDFSRIRAGGQTIVINDGEDAATDTWRYGSKESCLISSRHRRDIPSIFCSIATSIETLLR